MGYVPSFPFTRGQMQNFPRVLNSLHPPTSLTLITNSLCSRTGEAFARANSGTYNNEFHVVDYNLFEASLRQAPSTLPGRPALRLVPGVLTIVDQLPGNVEIQDRTDWLQEKGYWASYNRPGLSITHELARQRVLGVAQIQARQSCLQLPSHRTLSSITLFSRSSFRLGSSLTHELADQAGSHSLTSLPSHHFLTSFALFTHGCC
jgi:hypothetical protein